ncbi:MAG TPA: hypothetical protein VHV77_14145 [Pirellulales bacterium]|nr:hypothetical protein [Pirellulales bacterium]
MTTKDCLDLILEPMAKTFTVDFACKLVELRAPRELQQRVDELADKANEGTLTPAEQAEYKAFIDSSTILGVVQAKARRFLAQHAA